MKVLWTIVGVILFLLVVSFVLLNHQLVTLDYYIGALSLPLSVAILLAFIIGGIFFTLLFIASIATVVGFVLSN